MGGRAMYEADDPLRPTEEGQPCRPTGSEQVAPARSKLANPSDEMAEQAKSNEWQVHSLQRHYDYWFSLVDVVWLKPAEVTQKMAYELWR